MNTARVRKEDIDYSYNRGGYAENPIQQTPVIEGYFYYNKENLVKEMAIRRINQTLCGMLGIFVVATFISYYFAMSNEVTLNTLSRQITTLNDENNDLQNSLDRLKSFNNVDSKMLQQNVLQKAAKVIEVQAVASAAPVDKAPTAAAPFNWAIGY